MILRILNRITTNQQHRKQQQQQQLKHHRPQIHTDQLTEDVNVVEFITIMQIKYHQTEKLNQQQQHRYNPHNLLLCRLGQQLNQPHNHRHQSTEIHTIPVCHNKIQLSIKIMTKVQFRQLPIYKKLCPQHVHIMF